jgi:hypothetical protein
MELGLWPTIGLLVLCVGLVVLGEWRQTKPLNFLKPRIIPWRGVTLCAAFVGFLMLVHLVNLAGIPTGDPRYR